MLYKKMTKDKCNGKENWSDFECSLGELLKNSASAKVLEDALKEMAYHHLYKKCINSGCIV